MTTTHWMVLSASLSLGGLGCGAVASDPQLELTSAEAQRELARRVLPVRAERVREIDLAAFHQRIRKLQEAGTKAADLPRSTEFDDGDVVRIDHTGRAELYRYDRADLETAAAQASALGLNEPTAAEPVGSAPEAASGDDFPGLALRGLSNGVDNRTPRFISSAYPAGESALRRIGFLSVNDANTGEFYGSGSGALVGRRLVLTVAHAVVHPDDIVYRYDFVPRMDGASVLPYGLETAEFWFVPAQFLSNNCASNYEHWTCPQWDWAIIVLRDNAWSGQPSPGWMGYMNQSESTLKSYSVQHAGYPICGYPDSPAGCQYLRAYGTSSGSIKYFSHPGGSTNANLMLRHNHSVSPGHSGAPIYTYKGTAGPYVLGVWSVYLCSTCASSAEIDPVLGPSYPEYLTYPNLSRRIDKDLFNLLQSYRSQYP